MNGYTPGSSISQNYSGMQAPGGMPHANYPGSGYRGKDGQDKGNTRMHQNAEAVVRNIAKNKAKVREGKHAAAIDQLHENDLHGIEHFARRTEDRQDPRQDYMERKGHIGLHLRPRVRQNPAYEDTELTTSFDPMRDRHLWAMWRTAVNGRIVDEVRRMERNKVIEGRQFHQPPSHKDDKHRNQYGPSIVAPPLKRFIKLQEGSKEIAQHLSKEGKGQLQASQFVFYGLPRVYMERNGGPPK